MWKILAKDQEMKTLAMPGWKLLVHAECLRACPQIEGGLLI